MPTITKETPSISSNMCFPPGPYRLVGSWRRIKDAYDIEAEPFVSVMLYEVNDTFKDSVIYKENPRYITNTLDSLKRSAWKI
jgi:hypothetical protein